MKEFEIKNCKVTDIDLEVQKFTRILERYGDYVIVSGYLAIFCCRTRPTQDIDIIFRCFSDKDIEKLIEDIKNSGYDVYFDKISFFKEKLPFYVYTDYSIGDSFLYYEVKPPKDIYALISLNNRIKIRKGSVELYFSPIELQIAYKLFLGSDKDILDAKYLLDLFNEYIDKKELIKFATMLDVKEELEKIWK